MLGASSNELLLVALLLLVVMVAPKVGRVGEAVGGLFAAKRGAKRDRAGSADREDASP